MRAPRTVSYFVFVFLLSPPVFSPAQSTEWTLRVGEIRIKKHLRQYGPGRPWDQGLNRIGACWPHLGNEEAALRAWEKSLEIDPGQEELRARVKALKDKRRQPLYS
jgi:hypothetical protein